MTKIPLVENDEAVAELYERVWGTEASGDPSTVTVHIKRLRDKVELDPSMPELIRTVRNAGYRLKA